MVLFIVDTSLSGVLQVRAEPDVGARSGGRAIMSPSARPVNVTTSLEPELDAAQLQVLEAVAEAEQRRLDVGAAAPLHQLDHEVAGSVSTPSCGPMMPR